MHFFKKLVCLLGLFSAGISTAQEPQDTARIVTVLDKALQIELARISEQISKDTDLVKIGQIIKQELPAIKVKFSNAFRHALTEEERSVVVYLLSNYKDLSATTTADLMLIAQGCSTYERRVALGKALEKYCPDFLKQANFTTHDERVALTKELIKVDLHDASFNAFKKFMFECTHVDGYLNQNPDKIDDISLPLLQRGINHVNKAIAVPFVVFKDFYFSYGWQQEFKRTSDTFAIVNMVCGQLLEAIKQK